MRLSIGRHVARVLSHVGRSKVSKRVRLRLQILRVKADLSVLPPLAHHARVMLNSLHAGGRWTLRRVRVHWRPAKILVSRWQPSIIAAWREHLSLSTVALMLHRSIPLHASMLVVIILRSIVVINNDALSLWVHSKVAI